jgi:hypothetical protein
MSEKWGRADMLCLQIYVRKVPIADIPALAADSHYGLLMLAVARVSKVSIRLASLIVLKEERL